MKLFVGLVFGLVILVVWFGFKSCAGRGAATLCHNTLQLKIRMQLTHI